jgi:hypothetical protein
MYEERIRGALRFFQCGFLIAAAVRGDRVDSSCFHFLMMCPSLKIVKPAEK